MRDIKNEKIKETEKELSEEEKQERRRNLKIMDGNDPFN